LAELLRTPTRQLSLGQRMRCEIAASLIHSPKILFLDEPTIGLDAASKIAVREFVREQNREKGTTVILTTHDMQDIEALCSRILLIGKGQILLDGQLEQLKSRFATQKTLTVSYQGELCPLFPGLTLKERQPGRAVLLLDAGLLPVSEAIGRLSASMELTDLSVQEPTTEELVLKLYESFHIASDSKGGVPK
ncbi:MAG: ATP-binding cassette domain-containing protein, partial [Clostridiales bacterium]|nr:ATP-binding cassette domain-containing protein [Clostridiales bacterium]